MILLLLEIFVIPGFGVVGISGILLIVMGLTLAMVRNIDFDFSFVPSNSIGNSFLMVTLAMVAPLAILIAFGQNIFDSTLFKKMAVKGELTADEGYSVKEEKLNHLIGKQGVAKTVLRPTGKVSIAHESYEASSETDFIMAEEAIEVYGIRGNYLLVRKIEA